MLSGGVWFSIVVYFVFIVLCLSRMYKFYKGPEVLKDNDEYEIG